MNVKDLIDRATQQSKKTQAQFAEELGIKPARISEWKSGARKPEAGEIAYFADAAGLDVFPTVAAIEAQLRPNYAHLWKKAISSGAKSLLYLMPSKSGPSTGRFGPHFGWAGF